jgi:SHS family lactate transporter-like MFS transporter
MWAFAPNVPLLIVGAFVMQFMVQGAWGVIPAHINELAPNSARGFLSGFAYQCGAAISASVVYIEAAFAERMPYSRAMALVAVTVFSAAAITAWLGKEKTGIEFD